MEVIQDYENIWFKLLCYYNAKTELYDRSLTNRRSPWDKTEAYITYVNRDLSLYYSLKIKNFVLEIAKELCIPKKILNRGIYDNPYNLSAQEWIDMYCHFVEQDEMDFIEYYNI